MSSTEFYNRMAEGATTKTSQVNVNEYKEFFKSLLDEGYDILHVSLSSGFGLLVNTLASLREKGESIEEVFEYAENGLEYNGDCYISHSSCIDDANAVKELIEEKFVNLKGKVLINNIGTTIGSHTGPGTVALFFYGTKREN